MNNQESALFDLVQLASGKYSIMPPVKDHPVAGDDPVHVGSVKLDIAKEEVVISFLYESHIISDNGSRKRDRAMSNVLQKVQRMFPNFTVKFL